MEINWAKQWLTLFMFHNMQKWVKCSEQMLALLHAFLIQFGLDLVQIGLNSA